MICIPTGKLIRLPNKIYKSGASLAGLHRIGDKVRGVWHRIVDLGEVCSITRKASVNAL